MSLCQGDSHIVIHYGYYLLNKYLINNYLNESLQTAYKSRHSTGTAMVQMENDSFR